MMSGVGENGVITGNDTLGSGSNPSFRYITCAAEGAGCVIHVATKGMKRGWNMECFTSDRECLSVVRNGGYLYTGSQCIAALIKFLHIIMLANFVYAPASHTKCFQ